MAATLNGVDLAGVTIAPDVGTRVRLLRDGRVGRVVAHCLGGLLCRVRLDQGPKGGATLELPACELVPLIDMPAARLAPEPLPAAAEGPGPGSVVIRVIAPAAEAGTKPSWLDPTGRAPKPTTIAGRLRHLARAGDEVSPGLAEGPGPRWLQRHH